MKITQHYEMKGKKLYKINVNMQKNVLTAAMFVGI